MPESRERFLCDEMLSRLGRWLRVAGYDVAIAQPGDEDKNLLQLAMDEQRCFLSRDRKLLEHRGTEGGVQLISANDLPGQLQELSEAFSIDWQLAPFTRCLECNTELVVAESRLLNRVPEEALREGEQALYCSHCDKVYWHGSHVRRMRSKLRQLSQGIWDGNVDELTKLTL